MPQRLPSWPVHSFHYWALLAMVRPRGHIGPFLRLESEPRARMIAEDKENPCPTWHQQNSRAARRRRRRPAGGLRATGQSSQTAFFMRWQKNMRKTPGQGMQARSTMASPVQMPKEPHQQAEANGAFNSERRRDRSLLSLRHLLCTYSSSSSSPPTSSRMPSAAGTISSAPLWKGYLSCFVFG